MKHLPSHAKRVFTGVIFNVYQWQQIMYDGSEQVFEALSRPDTANIILVQDNKIAVLWEEQPFKPLFPSLPGGRLEEGENPLEWAARELLEETGYAGDDWAEFRTYENFGKLACQEHIFITKNASKIADPKPDGGERFEKLEWRSFDDFLQLCRNPKFVCSYSLRLEMYEALLESEKYTQMKQEIFGE